MDFEGGGDVYVCVRRPPACVSAHSTTITYPQEQPHFPLRRHGGQNLDR